MTNQIVQLKKGNSPLITAAIHDGHDVREDVKNILQLSEQDRLREEDPFTAEWISIAETQLLCKRSRFEVDLNRPREKAVYLKPEDAWGLMVWKQTPDESFINQSLAEYDVFYETINMLCTEFAERFNHFVIYDLHSYNHKRNGPNGEVADRTTNPDINVGTGTMLNRSIWADVIDRFISDLQSYNFPGQKLDVRENVKFKGGYFPLWIHKNFPDSACVLSIEVKKIFMNEWTGEPDRIKINAIREALKSTVPGVMSILKNMS